MNAVSYYFPAYAPWIFGGLIVAGVVLVVLVGRDVLKNFLHNEEAE